MPQPGPLAQPLVVRLCDFIRTRKDAIITAWKERIALLRPAIGQTSPALIDHLPWIVDFLSWYSRSLQESIEPPEQTVLNAPDCHALDRLGLGYALDELIEEYAVLRDVILLAWETEVGGWVSAAEIRRFHQAIDCAIAAASARFEGARMRLLRALNRLTEASVGTPDIDAFLGELVRATQETNEAVNTVVVLLREGDHLRVRAAAGLDQEVAAGFSLPIGEGFAGTIAAERRPMVLRTASRDPLLKSLIFGDQGLRVLYGVPLMHGGEVIGVAHMGSQTAEEFSDEDKLLFQTIAARATLVIVQEQLAAQERAARREGERAHALLVAVLDQMPAGVVMAEGSTGRILFANHESVAIWHGTPPAPQSIEEYGNFKGFHPETGRPYEAGDWPLARALRTGKVVEAEEIEIERHDDTRATLLVRAAPIAEASGSITAGVATFFDITSRKRTERAQRFLAEASVTLTEMLDDYEEALRRLARLTVPEIADWCIIEALQPDNTVGRLVAMEHQDPAKRMLGHQARLHLPSIREPQTLWARVLETRQPELVRAFSEEALALISSNPEFLQIAGGLGLRSLMVVPLVARDRVLGVMSLISAESGRIFDEVDLTVADALAHQAALAIDNARLYEQAQRELGFRDFVLGMVSHDLRNPLTTITLAARMIQRASGGQVGDATRRQAEAIHRSAERMERLIRDLLDYAALREGRLTLHREPHDPAALVREAVETVAGPAQTHGLHLTAEAAPDMPPVLCDRDRILQVLSNLLSNAIGVTPPGGAITVRCERTGKRAIFRVADTGPGIPEPEREHLFERFFRGINAAYTGTGLGLQICKALVDAHGGEMQVESEVGRGSTFTLCLPLGEAEPR